MQKIWNWMFRHTKQLQSLSCIAEFITLLVATWGQSVGCMLLAMGFLIFNLVMIHIKPPRDDDKFDDPGPDMPLVDEIDRYLRDKQKVGRSFL